MNSTDDVDIQSTPACDYIWARRSRRSFRFIVAAIVLLTTTLWFTEGYLKYDRYEIQYRLCLTLHPAQARPILRTVVRHEQENGIPPSALYLEALAQVEEPDKVVDTYKQAYQADPRNQSLLINYGCLLYAIGQFEEARERFREAGANPPSNALPRYLEAAALAQLLKDEEDSNDLMFLLTRVNLSEDPLVIPKPLWHNDLPQGGTRYLQLQWAIVERISMPLLQCADFICSRVNKCLEKGVLNNCVSALDEVEIMGQRLIGFRPEDSPPILNQLETALKIQLKVAQQKTQWPNIFRGDNNTEIAEQVVLLEKALKDVETSKNHYAIIAERHRERAIWPMNYLLNTTFVFLVFYGVGWALHHFGSGGKRIRSLPHIRIGRITPLVGFTGMSLLLLLYAVQRHHPLEEFPLDSLVCYGCYTITIALLCFGFIYPLLLLESSKYHLTGLSTKVPTSIVTQIQLAENIPFRRRMGIYGCLFRRYMGVLVGGMVIFVCVYLVLHRIFLSAYPFQYDLLNMGFDQEMEQLVAHLKEYFKKFS